MSYIGFRNFVTNDAAHQSLIELAGTGATWVAIVPHGWQPTLASDEVTFDKADLHAHGWVRQVIRWAAELNLKVMLKPHVEVQDASFRGWIQPPDLSRWFGSYQAWIVALAQLGEEEGVDQMSVGCELVSLAGEASHWSALIREVRKVFGGRLTYAANWDEFDKVSFWPYLDVPAVDTYFPLTDVPQPQVSDLIAGWQTWLPALRDLAAQHGGRVLISELGLASRAGAAAQPWDATGPGPLDLDVQATFYEASLRLFPTLDWIDGLYFWAWNADGVASATDTGISINGKPAADILRLAWSPPE